MPLNIIGGLHNNYSEVLFHKQAKNKKRPTIVDLSLAPQSGLEPETL
jgi:hypothetical protein